MFSRVKKLQKLLHSIDEKNIPKVYIADNGRITKEKQSLYDMTRTYELEIFDLEYDSGVGKCRKVLTKNTDEDILMFLDSDMVIPANYELLIDQLKANKNIGAVGGLINVKGRIKPPGIDLKEVNNKLTLGIWGEKQVEYIKNVPFIRYDMIPQVGVFRRECIEEYTWDERYKIRDHIDFFVGHKRNTEWVFGINLQVAFPHFKGGSPEYENHRKSEEKVSNDIKYLKEKWGYQEITYKDGFSTQQ